MANFLLKKDGKCYLLAFRFMIKKSNCIRESLECISSSKWNFSRTDKDQVRGVIGLIEEDRILSLLSWTGLFV